MWHGKILVNTFISKDYLVVNLDLRVKILKVGKKVLASKILANGSRFTKLANIFPRCIIALYGNRLLFIKSCTLLCMLHV